MASPAALQVAVRGFASTHRRMHVEGASRFSAQQRSKGSGVSHTSSSNASTSSFAASSTGGRGNRSGASARERLPSFGDVKRRVLAFLPFGWLINHAAGLFAYQMLIETMTTGCISTCLMYRTFTTADVKAFLEAAHYPFMGLINFESGVHNEDVEFMGGAQLDAHSYSALHCGHNIAMGLMPLQIALLLVTYPLVLRVWPKIKGPIGKIPVVGYLFTPVTIPAEATGWMNRVFGASLGGAAVVGGASGTTTTAAAGGLKGIRSQQKAAAGAGASWRR